MAFKMCYQYCTETVVGITNYCPDIGFSNVQSRLEMEENGWIFHVSHSDMVFHGERCGNNGWFGFYSGRSVGSISAHFKGSGTAMLIYGNCWIHNVVAVYLNHHKISLAYGNETHKEISFNFISGDMLRVEEDGAIIKLHSLTISCDGKYIFGYAIEIYNKNFINYIYRI